MRALLWLVAALAAALTTAVAQETRPLWTGTGATVDQTLFGEFRAYQEQNRFLTEPILDGEALPELLVRVGLDEEDANAAAAAFYAEAGVDKLEEGTSVRLKFRRSNATIHQLVTGTYPRGLEAMEVLVDADRVVVVGWRNGGFEAASREVELETRYIAAAGEINRSLFSAAMGAGVPRELMIRFADIFAFDVDFAREIYRGDRFEIVYEVLFDQDGREIATGEILFAGLTWKGGAGAGGYYRFRPEDAARASYYAADGRDPRTLLMKTPINGARVTSRFGRRRHPVLGYTKGHAGIDFGAPTGTPIMAAGDGVVKLAGPRGTFGNYIRIEHAGGLETAYAHLNAFALGVKPGKKVQQGEVIGYVGTTGRSTGPHLHYEVLMRGVAQNPETIKVAVGETLEGEAQETFLVRKDAVDSLRIRPFAVANARLP